MRYKNEIEGILKISEEFGSKTLNKYHILQAIYGKESWKNKDLASLSHKLANMSILFKQSNEIGRFVQDLQKKVEILDSKFCKGTAADKTLWDEVQKAILPKVEDSSKLLEIGSHKFKQLKEEVESILMTSGHYDPADLSPYLEKDNQDQLIMLKIILKLLHPNGRSHCSDSNIIETEATTEVSTESPNMSPDSNVLETKATTKATTELPNMSPDSNVIETEAPKSDMINVDLKTQDTPLDPKQNLMAKKVIETEAPKNDMITVDLKTQGT